MTANAVPPQVSVRVLLQGSGASQPTAEPRAEVTPCAGAGDSLFMALSFAKVVCIDGKEWPKSEDTQKKYGATLRKWYLDWIEHKKLLLNNDPFIEGLPARSVILGVSTCSTIEEYMSEIKAPTMDARSWGGWAEIVLIAAKWQVAISLCWRRSEGEAVLFAQTTRAIVKPRVRPAVLFHPDGGHYEILQLSSSQWESVDAQIRPRQ